MIRIEYPSHPFRMREEEGKELIFDELRKLWVRLTPEEWVRQNILQYILQNMSYPAALIAVEKELKLGDLTKRFDILVYNRQHKPWLMIECKSMETPITDETVYQILRYNLSIPVRYLVVTNGSASYFFERGGTGMNGISGMPEWEQEP